MYTLEFKRQLNIFFNSDPSEILSAKDVEAILSHKSHFPKITLTIVFSSRLLAPFALQKFRDFCSKHHIIAIDFDTDLNINLSNNSRDGKLYELANIEIDAFLNSQNGNLIAASHLVRFMRRVLEQGIFTESGTFFHQYIPNLNIETDLQNRQSYSGLNCNIPILLGLGNYTVYNQTTSYFNTFKGAQFNFIGLVNVEQWGQHHQDELLSRLQDKMIEQYSNPLKKLLQSDAIDIGTFLAVHNALNLDPQLPYTAPQIRNLFLTNIRDGIFDNLYALVIYLYLNDEYYPLLEPIYQSYVETGTLYNLKAIVQSRLTPLEFAQLEKNTIRILAPQFVFDYNERFNDMNDNFNLVLKKLCILENVKHQLLFSAIFSFTDASKLFKMVNDFISNIRLKLEKQPPLLFQTITFSNSFELSDQDELDLGVYRCKP